MNSLHSFKQSSSNIDFSLKSFLIHCNHFLVIWCIKNFSMWIWFKKSGKNAVRFYWVRKVLEKVLLESDPNLWDCWGPKVLVFMAGKEKKQPKEVKKWLNSKLHFPVVSKTNYIMSVIFFKTNKPSLKFCDNCSILV